MINMLQDLNWRRIYLAFAAAVLLVPAAGMWFSSEVAWGPGDFLAAALLLGGAWVAVEVIVRLMPEGFGRLAFVAVVAIAALAVWAHLAIQF